jgi:hypothetical protein
MMASAFLDEGGVAPDRAPKLPRRRAAGWLLLGAALGLASGGMVIYGASTKNSAVLRPGPRRYPPAYRPWPHSADTGD